ncbi:MAG: sigma-70 family RNA polymerase sigma factor [Solirubrobacterales bacterium]
MEFANTGAAALQPESGAVHPDRARPATGPDSRIVSAAIAGAQAGDSEALHFLYIRYVDDVLRYVRSVVGDHHEAEDITQNVFMKLVTIIGKYEPREVPFAAWILRVARNAALDHLRARRAIPVEEVRTSSTGDDSLVGRERGRDLREALERLPEDQREVLVLRHIVGLSPLEIAEVLGKTESSVHGLHHRGRQTLQSALTEFGASPVVAPSQLA